MFGFLLGRPADAGTAALNVDVLYLLCSGVFGMTHMVVVFCGAHVFPRLPLVNTQLITVIQAVICQLRPHAIPFGVVRVYIFQGLHLSLMVRAFN